MKRTRMKLVRIFGVCLVLVLVGFLLPYEGKAQKSLSIGTLLPMTGPQAYYGNKMYNGSIMAVEEINATGGVAGYKLKLEVVDYKNVDVNLAITGTRKMVTIDKIPALLPSFNSVILGVQPICAKANVVMFNGGADSPLLMNLPYLHTTRLLQSQLVYRILDFFWKMGIRRLAAIYSSGPGTEIPIQQVLKPEWTKMGGTIVASEPHEYGAIDYSAHLARIKAAKPDAIYDLSTGQDTAFIVKGAREIGLTCPIHTRDWDASYQAISGKTSDNVYVCMEYFDRESQNPSTRKFVKAYEARSKEPPDFFSANYYDAIYIIAELINRVVAKGGNPLDGGQLESTIWDNPKFDSVFGGKLELLRDGTARKMSSIFRIIDGKLTLADRVSY